MRKHQTHFLAKLPGNAPQISSNICILETSSKIMTFTALLHIYVSDFSADLIQITELLRSHLVAVKAAIDDDAMVILLTPIISNLLAICGYVDSLTLSSFRERRTMQELSDLAPKLLDQFRPGST